MKLVNAIVNLGIQNFYEDLVTGFYKFLNDKSKYEKLRNELYEN
jgi:hypothetical protein